MLHDAIPIVPGRYAAVAFVRWTEPPNQVATVKLKMVLINAAGNSISQPPSTEIRPSGGGPCMKPSAGGWTALSLTADIPSEIKGEQVKMARLGVEYSRISAGTTLYVDDVAMFRLPD